MNGTTNPTPKTEIEIAIADVQIDENRSPFGDVDGVAKSVKEVGLLNAINITPQNRLIAGHTRLLACKQLGWTHIRAVVLDLDDLTSELAELDENLVRKHLAPLELGEQLTRRQKIYEELHPDAKAGVRRPAGMNRSIGNNVDEISSPTFVQDTAAKTGMSERTIQQAAQMASNISPEVKALIKGTGMARNKTALLKIARLPKDKQRDAVEKKLVEEKSKKPHSRKLKTWTPPPEVVDRFSAIVADASLWDSDDDGESRRYWGAKIAELANAHSTLWLWMTSEQFRGGYDYALPCAFDVIAILPWVKTFEASAARGGDVEFCVVAASGNHTVEIPDTGLALLGAAIEGCKRPQAFYDLVEQSAPGAKIELGMDNQRPGWGTSTADLKNSVSAV